MLFSRDCRRGLVVPTVGSSVLESSCTKVHSGSRQSLHAVLYLLHAVLRAVVTRAVRPRPAGQPLAVVSATLRPLALIAMYVCLFRLRAPTVGASLQGCN